MSDSESSSDNDAIFDGRRIPDSDEDNIDITDAIPSNDLTIEQSDMLAEFQSMSGLEDVQRCREVLESTNWNLGNAVDRHFEFDTQENIVQNAQNQLIQNRANHASGPIPTVGIYPGVRNIYPHLYRRNHRLSWIQWGYSLIIMPFRFIIITAWDLISFIFSIFLPEYRARVTDPVGDVESFIRNFEEKYGSDSHPVFFRGSYSQALDTAKRELRFLLVYLHSEQHQDTPKFCREVLSDKDLVQLVNSQTLFWACDVGSPEGYRVSRAMRELSYPFLALICLMQNKMMVVGRVEGLADSNQLVTWLGEVMNDNEASLVAERHERRQRQEAQAIRDEQEQQLAHSRQIDMQKLEERRKLEEAKKREQEEEERLRREEEQRIVELAEKKQKIKEELKPEPDNSEPNIIRIVLKFLGGDRVHRTFRLDQSLEDLYNFVFCHELAPDNFHIVKNFPRTEIPCSPTNGLPLPTFQESGLTTNEVLFIQDNEA